MRKSKPPLSRTPKAPAAPRPVRVQFSITMNAKLLRAVDRIATETGRHRSEQFDRLAEHYLATHAEGKLAK
jgi:metal-responsive CopG/Arc/MetJ family transcriptional regulator